MNVAEVASWLLGHGIIASTVVPDSAGGVTEQLDRIAADVGAGAVIAGAYGHSRFSEWILGGVTRQLVDPSNRCSLLSH
jgi:nucleotide-binding universal stress UspA family protein